MTLFVALTDAELETIFARIALLLFQVFLTSHKATHLHVKISNVRASVERSGTGGATATKRQCRYAQHWLEQRALRKRGTMENLRQQGLCTIFES